MTTRIGPVKADFARRARRVGQRLTFGWWFLVLLMVLTCYPVVFLVFTALKDPIEYITNSAGPPHHWTFANVVSALGQGGVAQNIVNSIIVVGIGVGIAIVCASAAGFALSILKFPGRRVLFLGMVAVMLLPPSVQILQIFLIVKDLGLINTYPGLGLVYGAFCIPFDTYLIASYLRGIPREIFEAAEVDGAGVGRAFLLIALPAARPALLAIITLNFLWLWNDLLFALLILQNPDNRTVMVGLSSTLGQYPTVPAEAAIGLIALVPPLLVFAVFQRSLATGVTAHAVK